jgi:hypothetical protein
MTQVFDNEEALLEGLVRMSNEEENGWSIANLAARINKASKKANKEERRQLKGVSENLSVRELAARALARIAESDAFYDEFCRLGNIRIKGLPLADGKDGSAGDEGEDAGDNLVANEAELHAAAEEESDQEDALAEEASDEREEGDHQGDWPQFVAEGLDEMEIGTNLTFKPAEIRGQLVDGAKPPFPVPLTRSLLEASKGVRILDKDAVKRMANSLQRPPKDIFPKAPRPVLRQKDAKAREIELFNTQCMVHDLASVTLHCAEILAATARPDDKELQNLAVTASTISLHVVEKLKHDRSCYEAKIMGLRPGRLDEQGRVKSAIGPTMRERLA